MSQCGAYFLCVTLPLHKLVYAKAHNPTQFDFLKKKKYIYIYIYIHYILRFDDKVTLFDP